MYTKHIIMPCSVAVDSTLCYEYAYDSGRLLRLNGACLRVSLTGGAACDKETASFIKLENHYEYFVCVRARLSAASNQTGGKRLVSLNIFPKHRKISIYLSVSIYKAAILKVNPHQGAIYVGIWAPKVGKKKRGQLKNRYIPTEIIVKERWCWP